MRPKHNTCFGLSLCRGSQIVVWPAWLCMCMGHALLITNRPRVTRIVVWPGCACALAMQSQPQKKRTAHDRQVERHRCNLHCRGNLSSWGCHTSEEHPIHFSVGKEEGVAQSILAWDPVMVDLRSRSQQDLRGLTFAVCAHTDTDTQTDKHTQTDRHRHTSGVSVLFR